MSSKSRIGRQVHAFLQTVDNWGQSAPFKIFFIIISKLFVRKDLERVRASALEAETRVENLSSCPTSTSCALLVGLSCICAVPGTWAMIHQCGDLRNKKPVGIWTLYFMIMTRSLPKVSCLWHWGRGPKHETELNWGQPSGLEAQSLSTTIITSKTLRH